MTGSPSAIFSIVQSSQNLVEKQEKRNRRIYRKEQKKDYKEGYEKGFKTNKLGEYSTAFRIFNKSDSWLEGWSAGIKAKRLKKVI